MSNPTFDAVRKQLDESLPNDIDERAKEVKALDLYYQLWAERVYPSFQRSKVMSLSTEMQELRVGIIVKFEEEFAKKNMPEHEMEIRIEAVSRKVSAQIHSLCELVPESDIPKYEKNIIKATRKALRKITVPDEGDDADEEAGEAAGEDEGQETKPAKDWHPAYQGPSHVESGLLQVSVLQENFYLALDFAKRFMVWDTGDPESLSCVRLSVHNSRLMVNTTSLNLGVQFTGWVGARPELPTGGCIVNMKMLHEFVRTMSKERVDITQRDDEGQMSLRCGVSIWKIKSESADSFPPPDCYEGDSDIEVEVNDFANLLQRVTFAIATEQNRPILTTVYLQVKNGVMTAAGADGYRLGTARMKISDKSIDETYCINGKATKQLLHILRKLKGQKMSFHFGKRLVMNMCNTQIVFDNMLGTTHSRYPDYASIIPRSHDTKAEVYASDLEAVVKRVMPIARNNANSVSLKVCPARNLGEPAVFTVLAKAFGDECESMLDARAEGEPTDVSINGKYLLDTVKHYGTLSERLRVFFNGCENPIVLRPENTDDYLCVLMPMSK